MRLLVLASLLAVPAAAQTAEAPSTSPPDSTEALQAAPPASDASALDVAAPDVRTYSAFQLGGAWSSSAGALTHLRGAVGAEFPSGVRVGGAGSVTTTGAQTTVAVGPEVGYDRALGRGFVLRSRGVAGVAVTSGTNTVRNTSYGSRSAGLGAALSVEREIPVVGSVRLAPRVGAYGTVARRSAVPEFDVDARTIGSAGLLLGTDIRFRALGRDWSIPLGVPVEVLGNAGAGHPLGGRLF